jgi:hypothetical protein
VIRALHGLKDGIYVLGRRRPRQAASGDPSLDRRSGLDELREVDSGGIWRKLRRCEAAIMTMRDAPLIKEENPSKVEVTFGPFRLSAAERLIERSGEPL